MRRTPPVRFFGTKVRDGAAAGIRAKASRTEACALAADGRHIKTIELLSATNRVARDAETEALLVRLRHQAFAPLSRSSSTIAWPPILADPFPTIT
jgi:hypothetical protein